jgi:hypothetical protein
MRGNDKITANGTIYGNEGDDTLKTIVVMILFMVAREMIS